MSSLEGRTILVTGASGQVGWGVAHAASDAGARLVLPSRSEERAAELRREFGAGNTSVVHADMSTGQGMDAVVSAIDDLGGLDHVFAAVGSWWQKGASLDQPSSELDELLDTYVGVQFRLLRRSRKWLEASGGSYTLVTGAAGEHSMPGAGLLVVAVRAQYALSSVLREELASASFRLNELRIATRIERVPRDGVVPSRTAGAAFLDVMTGQAQAEVIRYPG